MGDLVRQEGWWGPLYCLMSRTVAVTTLNICCIGHIVRGTIKWTEPGESWIQTQAGTKTALRGAPGDGSLGSENLMGCLQAQNGLLQVVGPAGAEPARWGPLVSQALWLSAPHATRALPRRGCAAVIPEDVSKSDVSTLLRSTWERLSQQSLGCYQEDKRTVKPTWTPHPTAPPSYQEKHQSLFGGGIRRQKLTSLPQSLSVWSHLGYKK